MSVDNILRLQEADVARDQEIDRIVALNAKDYFAILEINPLLNFDGLVKKMYRKKSLLIHPDKVKHPQAPIAFDALKKAQLVLATEEDGDEEAKKRLHERNALVEVYKEISIGLKASIHGAFNHPVNVEIRDKVLLVLDNHAKQEEVERMYNQRQEATRNEELKNAAKDRQLRRQWESRWEDDRDSRVQLWRSYVSKVDKKKKKPKKKVLV